MIQSARLALQTNDYVNSKIYARESENMLRTLKPQIEAKRKKIIETDPDLKMCGKCNKKTVKVFKKGDARCMSCGQMFEVRHQAGDKKKKKWGGIFGK